jgi:hypothetical protein
MTRIAVAETGYRLDLKLTEGRLEGQYSRGARGAYAFKAARASKTEGDTAADKAPSIAGVYTIPTQSSKGEAAWRFIVEQDGGEVSAAILRVDGDTGALTGKWRDAKFVLSHFSGARPSVLEVAPTADGTLELLQARSSSSASRGAGARTATTKRRSSPNSRASIGRRDWKWSRSRSKRPNSWRIRRGYVRS